MKIIGRDVEGSNTELVLARATAARSVERNCATAWESKPGWQFFEL